MMDIETGQTKDHSIVRRPPAERKESRRDPYIYAYRDDGGPIFCFLAAGTCMVFLIIVVYMASK